MKWVRLLLEELAVRFLVGGAIVSAFAVIGNLFKPKTFAGLFGAAPSVAIATLAMTASKEGPAYASTEARSMLAGAAALWAFCVVAAILLKRTNLKAFASSLSAIPVWFACAFALFWIAIR